MHIGNQRSKGRPTPNSRPTLGRVLETSMDSGSLTGRLFSESAILLPSFDEVSRDGAFTIRGIGGGEYE